MTRKRNNAFCFLLMCLTLVNFPASLVATSFVVLHAWALYLSIIGCHEEAFAICMELGSIANKSWYKEWEIYILYRPQIVYESCSSYAWQGKRTVSSAAFFDGHAYLVISISRVSSTIWNLVTSFSKLHSSGTHPVQPFPLSEVSLACETT